MPSWSFYYSNVLNISILDAMNGLYFIISINKCRNSKSGIPVIKETTIELQKGAGYVVFPKEIF